MERTAFFAQTAVYFRKLRRIGMHESCGRLMIFAFVISFTVAAVVGGDMFTDFESTRSGFFSLTSAAIWIGVFNSIQSVCREHRVIRSEYRSGLMLSAYITAHALWQLLISLFQSAVMLAASLCFADLSGEGVLLPAPAEYFITLFLLTYGADMLGVMISSAAGTPASAMTIMPFVLIIQLIMSGVLFDLSGWSEAVSCLTFSKWGMCAFGSTADLNSEELPLRLHEAFPNVVRLSRDTACEHIPGDLLFAWGMIILITLACIFSGIAILRFRNTRPETG